MDIIPTFVADRKPAVLGEPCQRTFYDPPMPAQFLGAFHALSGYAPFYAPLSERPSALGVVVSLVGVQLLGALARSAARLSDRRDGIYGFFQEL